ncbi:WD and tetratricopeptide repeat protein, putative isoform 4 [Hibiscus syriacus]|uniref:WD and tetratricopeptide repeat protein, putative isoform 4 n=1 Tax=Hibiscus syriacus TaxID=106335 RepID=A0A6A2XXS3_HIBSY|nr:WD and tetratricopeptide repeat protein, putative isoform 4 [Hibiscus syriacus]
MEEWPFHDCNVHNLLENRHIDIGHDVGHSLQMHSSLIRRLSMEQELEGHQGCVNAVAWNSDGSLLISGSDDERINIWSYSGRKLLHSIETGHSANIFCTKFIPQTSDDLVVSGAGDAEVRSFILSRLNERGLNDGAVTPSALYRCHTRRVKKLAVEVGNPNMIWSASEDGTLRQHDFREGTSCPLAGSSHQACRSVLGWEWSRRGQIFPNPPLLYRCYTLLHLLSRPQWMRNPENIHPCSNPSCPYRFIFSSYFSTRPHLLLVGGSDAFARLYDRRMLPPLSSCRKRIPNGEEVLLSYSGEHVYLMDINHASESLTQYTSGDASKLMTFTPVLNKLEHQPPASSVFKNGVRSRSNTAARIEKCRMLVESAKRFLDEGINIFHAIEACNEVLDGHGSDIGPTLRLECFCTRAALLLKRKWKNDAHMAIRDCNNARRIDSSSFRAHYLMAEALEQLGKHKEALEFAVPAQCLSPYDTMAAEKVENIIKHLATVEAEKSNKASDGAPRSEPRTGRVLSLTDILYRSEANSDALQDGPRSERGDSDFDEELELDFETSISGDEVHDVESNMLHGSVNLRIHRRGDSTRETGAYSSCGSPSSSSQNGAAYQPEAVIDMKRRYAGHCNVGTDIKQASFLGQRGEFVASGSDDGRWFIWEKKTGRLIKMLLGDDAVVNCVQCHPFDCFVATSGIDNTIKANIGFMGRLWTPTAAVPSMVSGGSAGPEAANVLEAMESNQRKLCRNREAFLPFELLERFRMHEFSEGSLQPFECAQS